MKWLFCLLVFILLVTPGCSLREREQQLDNRTNELNQKEQELLLKEKSLELRETELTKKEEFLDSTLGVFNMFDSLQPMDSNFIGNWAVRMRCTETNCPGSAIGDEKTEIWQISFQGHSVIAKAMDNKQLVRSYTGYFRENRVQLVAQHYDSAAQPPSNIVVTLQPPKDKQTTGRREIIRPDVCKIVYDLELKKQ